ncbi:Cyanate hydratase, variant 2 [Orbilia oligospora]|uniref:Multiprotein-bridging factor 1 n=1 Tax=Orbilia oligospora TaxID=2813651 RepID=A0A7C8RD81_ORBOL|nr:Cyanate hydratase, variant 2 [Orbilia oligospora]
MSGSPTFSKSEITASLVRAKQERKISFEELGKAIGRDEVAVAAIFYGQHHASREDIVGLAKALNIDENLLSSQLSDFPDRGSGVEMPRKFRLAELNYPRVIFPF